MAHDTWIDDYYVDSSGAWIPGRYQERWVQSGTRWWYEYSDGGYAIGWKNINGIWYYFDRIWLDANRLAIHRGKMVLFAIEWSNDWRRLACYR